ncbi:MAG: phytanoyl-CoA dioxygenase family protein [Pseudomonadota bacterium]
MTEVVFERLAEAYDPGLYAGSLPATSLAGFEAVDDEALAQYTAFGYLHIERAFSAEEVDAGRTELEAMALAADPRCKAVFYEGLLRRHLAMEGPARLGEGVEQGKNFSMGETAEELPVVDPELRARHVRKFMGFVEHHPPLRVFAEKPPLAQLIERLIGGPYRIYQDMALIKPPGGREKPWHQDHAYFNFPLDTRIVGIWIPFEEVTPENGCMHLLAGAHRDGPQTHFMRRDWQICDTEIPHSNQTAVPMAAGDVLLFDAKLPHGTPANRTDSMRWAVQYHFVPENVVRTDDQVRLEAFGAEGKDVTC